AAGCAGRVGCRTMVRPGTPARFRRAGVPRQAAGSVPVPVPVPALVPVPVLVVSDHAEAAHHSVPDVHAPGVTRVHAVAGAVGPDSGDGSAVVAHRPAEDLDGLAAVVADVQGLGAQAADHGDAAARVGRVLPLVDLDPALLVELPAFPAFPAFPSLI